MEDDDRTIQLSAMGLSRNDQIRGRFTKPLPHVGSHDARETPGPDERVAGPSGNRVFRRQGFDDDLLSDRD